MSEDPQSAEPAPQSEEQAEAPLVLPPPGKVDPETLVLRARPARAIRFKRGLILSIVALAAAGVVGTAWFALEPHALHIAAGSDDQTIAAKPPADTLSALPESYAAVPKLGPPLPGDLGRPISIDSGNSAPNRFQRPRPARRNQPRKRGSCGLPS